MKETVRLNLDFPKNEYSYLEMISEQKGMSFQDFAISLFLKAIEEFEDEMLSKKAKNRLLEMSHEETLSWEEACKLTGWKDEKEDLC